MLYGTSWAVTKLFVHKMSIVEMRMLKCLCDNISKDKIKNKVIHKKVKVASNEDKLKE